MAITLAPLGPLRFPASPDAIAAQIAAQLVAPPRVWTIVWANAASEAEPPPDRATTAGSTDLGHGADADVELMLRFQKGDRRCFDALFQKYKRPVLNFVLRLTGRRDLAEELTQDIFVKCFQAAPSYRPEAKFSTWLFRIARNHCLNEMRRPSFRRPPEPLEPGRRASHAASPEAEVAARDLQRVVQASLASLPERQRTALLLCRTQHMAYDEIAQAMETSVSAIKSLLNRAKEQLVADLQRHGGAFHEV